MLTVFRRINKCPTSGQRFSDKFPTAGIDKKTNARGGGGGVDARLELTEPLIPSKKNQSVRIAKISSHNQGSTLTVAN